MVNKIMKCKETDGYKYLTKGCYYEVTNESSNTVVIINDIDIKCNFPKKLFEKVVDNI